jgi:hypothetical protein
MVTPKDVHWLDIERAKDFVREPLSEGFKAWSTLRDRDNVTMTIHELAHLMAWYAAVRMDQRDDTSESQTDRLESGTLSLTEGQTHG